MDMGRPPKYTDDLALKILEEIATTHKGLRTICKENDLNVSTLLVWLSEDKDFSARYARAKESQADLLAEEILELADKERELIEEVTTGEGSYQTKKDNIARSRLQVDARKWLASKLKPKKYGDTQQADKSDTPPISFDDFIKKIDNV
jgi:transposase-like protein